MCFGFPLEKGKWLKMTVDFQRMRCEVLYFSPSRDVKRRAVSLRKKRGKESCWHSQGFQKLISRSSVGSYSMQPEPRPLELVTYPSWRPPLALTVPPSLGQRHSCQRQSCGLSRLQHTEDVTPTGNEENGDGGRRNTN